MMIDRGRAREARAAGGVRPARHLARCRSACSATGPGRRWRAPIRSASRSTAGRRTARCRGSASIRSSPRRRSCSALQTVVSRQVDLTREPAVVTVGMIKGGVRQNIIPDSVEMRGTIRTFDEEMRDDIHERVTTLSESIAKGARATCRVCITKNYPVTVNDPGADRGDGADAGARRRRGQGAGRAQGHGLGGLLVLPAGGAGPVLLPRRRARGHGSRRTWRRTTRRASSSTRRAWWSACGR